MLILKALQMKVFSPRREKFIFSRDCVRLEVKSFMNGKLKGFSKAFAKHLKCVGIKAFVA